MLVIYDSMTGNVERFVGKTPFPKIKVSKDLLVTEPFVLVTYTVGFGQVPDTTNNFLKYNHEHLIAVSSSGNRNWGQSFAKSGEMIAEQYNVPLLLKFELSGLKSDVEKFMEGVRDLYEVS